MSEPIIRVEGLSKKYRLRHQSKERYTTLRDVLARKVKAVFSPAGKATESTSADEDFWALRDLNFEIQRGEVVGIIGRNGAGKSTLLKILSRITEPTTGRITLRGRIASLLEVGTGFHPELSGRENIYLNGAILGMSKGEIKSKFDEIVAFAEVEKFLDTPVKHYSSGMYVRLAFAVAAHLEPEILVVDEVLAVGDAEFQRKCLGKMQDVAGQGRTVLFVSHNLPMVQRLCSSGVVLREGRVIRRSSVEDCIGSYLEAGQQSASFSANLQSVPQSSEDGFKFLSIGITDAVGKPVEHLTVGQDCHVELQFECSRAHRELVLGFAVRTSDEFPLFATHNNDFGESYSVQPGSYAVRMHLNPNFLKATRYSISIGAISSGSAICHITSALVVDVNPVSSDGLRQVDERIGALFIPMKWGSPRRVEQ